MGSQSHTATRSGPAAGPVIVRSYTDINRQNITTHLGTVTIKSRHSIGIFSTLQKR